MYLALAKSNVEDALFSFKTIKKIRFLQNDKENEAQFFCTISSLSN